MERWNWEVIGVCVSAAMAVIAFVGGCWLGRSDALAPNEIDPSEGQRFFMQFYFPAVLHDPEGALNRWGTDQFRAQKKASGMRNYISWYRNTEAIDHPDVVRHGEEPYLFDVSFYRRLKSGKVTERKIVVYGLECASIWQAYRPWGRCEAENLRINYNARIPA
jgi:hypothetical protein